MMRSLFLPILLLFTPLFASAQLKVNDKAPALVITNWLKNVPPSKDFSDKFIVIDFWATWCAPCLESVPHMNNLVNENKSRTNLVFLAMTDEKEEKVDRLLNIVKFSSVVVSDVTRKTLESFKVNSIPHCVLIDNKNVIRWIGNSQDLTNDVIKSVIDNSIIPVSKEKKAALLSKEVDKMYTSLNNRYATYFKDQDLKEYFSMTLSPFKKKYISYAMLGASYNEVVIGDSLVGRLSNFLDVAENQIILPDNLSGSYISYCYKSEKENTKSQAFTKILNHTNLKYILSDSLVDVIQLEVSDKELLKKFLSDSLPHVGHASWSDNFAAIDHDDFLKLTKTIEEKFGKAVVIKRNNILDNKMSMTIKMDDMHHLIESFQSYGIKASVVKSKVKLYRFIPKT